MANEDVKRNASSFCFEVCLHPNSIIVTKVDLIIVAGSVDTPVSRKSERPGGNAKDREGKKRNRKKKGASKRLCAHPESKRQAELATSDSSPTANKREQIKVDTTSLKVRM